MLGWVLAAMGAACLMVSSSEKSKTISEQKRIIGFQNNEIHRLKTENRLLKLTIQNQRQLLKDYDTVNKYSKLLGYKGAVDFFYYLAKAHDMRFGHFARFLNKVRHMRNDVAHEGKIYYIEDNFLKKLKACVYICNEYNRLPNGKRLLLS